MTPFNHTISRAAIKAAVPRISGIRGETSYDVDTHIAAMLDVALEDAYQADMVHEILDTWRGDQQTYLAKLCFPAGIKLVGLVGPNHEPRVDYPFTGSSNKTLISVCDYMEAARSFTTGQWKSMDGKPVLLSADVPSRLEHKPKKRVKTTSAHPTHRPTPPPTVIRRPRQSSMVANFGEPVTKKCNVCEAELPLTSFYTDGPARLKNACKECCKRKQREKRTAKQAPVKLTPIAFASPNTVPVGGSVDHDGPILLERRAEHTPLVDIRQALRLAFSKEDQAADVARQAESAVAACEADLEDAKQEAERCQNYLKSVQQEISDLLSTGAISPTPAL